MKKYLARNHRFYVNNSQNWVEISGLSSWSVQYTSEVSDSSKYNSQGWTSSIITKRTGVINLEGFYLANNSGERDLGQYTCEIAASNLGYNGLRGVKIEAFDSNGYTIGLITCSGSISLSPVTGNVRSLNSWGISVNLKGIPLGSGIYNIFDQETYPLPASGIDRSGMWTGVLGMYTYAE
jgi:hypothetical protein